MLIFTKQNFIKIRHIHDKEIHNGVDQPFYGNGGYEYNINKTNLDEIEHL